MAVFQGSAERSLSALARFGSQAAPILAVAGALGVMANQAATVQQNVANLNAVLRATPQQLAAIRQQGLSLSQVTQFTDSQILLAQRQLAKGQQTPAQIMRETPGTLNLAGATQSTPQQAATSFISAARQFRQDSSQTTAVVDTLAQATDASLGSLQQLTAGFRNVGPVANSVGIDLRTTATALADLSQAGLQSAQGGTALRTFLQHIQRETPQARAEVKKLGLEFYDSQGHMRALTDIMDQLRQKTAGLTQEARDASLTTIFGTRGALAADIYAEQGSSGYADTQKSMEDLGSAADIQRRKMDTLQGSISKLTSSLNVLAVQGGTGVLPMLRAFTDDAEHLTNRLTSLNNAVPLLPQAAVAGAAIFGINRLNNVGVQQRRRSAAELARAQETAAGPSNQAFSDRKDAQIENDLAYSRLTRQRGEKLSALPAAENAEIDAARVKSTEAWAAANDRAAAHVVEVQNATAQKLIDLDKATAEARRQSFAEQAAAVDALRDAEAQRFADNTRLADIQMRQDREALAIRQDFAHRRLDLASQQATGANAPVIEHINLAQQQQLARQEQTALANNVLNFNPERQTLREDQMNREIDAVRRAGDVKRVAIEADARETAAALTSATADEVHAISRAAGLEVDAITAAETKEVAAIRARYMAEIDAITVGTNEAIAAANVAMGRQLQNADRLAAEGTAASRAAGQTAANATKGGFGGKVTGALGQIGIAALAVVTIKDMVITPIEQAVYQHAVDNDPQLKQLTIQTSMAIDPSGLDASPSQQQDLLRNARKSVDDAIKQTEADVERMKPGGLAKILSNTFGDDKDLGAAKIKLQTLEGLEQSLDKSLGAFSPESKKAKLDQAKGDLASSIADIVALFDNGAITMNEAEGRAINAAFSILSPVDDNFSKDLSQTKVDVAKTLRQHAAAARQQAMLDAQTYADNIDAATKASGAGADDQTILAGIFGKDVNGDDATAQMVQQAKKHITDLEQAATTAAEDIKRAWTDAQSAISGVDPAKGIAGLAENATKLKQANDELARLGQKNPQLSQLSQIAASFKTIADAEDKASEAFNGYLMMFNQTDSAQGKLGALRKEVDQAMKDAMAARAMGNATTDQNWLLNNSTSIYGNLAKGQGQLAAHQAGDIRGMLENVPDYSTIDTANRLNVTQQGGAQNLLATVTLDKKTAEQEITDWLKQPREVTVEVKWQYPVTDPWSQSELAHGSQPPIQSGGTSPGVYGPAIMPGGYSPYDDSNIKSPPPGAGGSNPSAWDPTSTQKNQAASGWNQFQGMTPDQFMAIVKNGAGGAQSPFANTGTYANVMQAARAANVDPRVLLAWTKDESGNGTTSSPELSRINNFGGIQYAGQPGAYDAGFAEPAYNGQKHNNFAGFNSPQDFWNAIAANVSKAPYNDLYGQGDLVGVSKKYAEAPGTRVQDYIDYKNQYPSTGAGPTSGYDPARGYGAGGYSPTKTAQSEHLTTEQAIASANDVQLPDPRSAATSGGTNAIYQAAVKDLGQKKDKFGNDVYGWCLEITEDIMQQAGFDERGKLPASVTQNADTRLRAAQQGVPGAGRVISQKEAVPGDIVGWEGSNPTAGDPRGHIGIYAGSGQYIGTTENGVQSRPLPLGGQGAIFVRPDGVLATTATGSPAAGGPQFGTGNYGQPAPRYVNPNIYDVGNQSRVLQGVFHNMNPADITASLSRMGNTAGFFEKYYTQGVDPSNAYGMQQGKQQGAQANLNFGITFAQAMKDARDPTKDLTADYERIRLTGGPIADNAIKWLEAQRNINTATQQNVVYQSQLKDSQEATFQQARRRQDEDISLAASRRTRDRKRELDDFNAQQGFQSRQRGIETETVTEDVSFTGLSRKHEDDQRLAQFQQQVQATDLQNKLADTQKAQQQQIYQRTSAEQVLYGQVKGASTNVGAAQGAAALSMMHDQDLAQRDRNTKAIDDIQLEIREQTKKTNVINFNTETEWIKATRAHEDRMRAIGDESRKLSHDQQDYSSKQQIIARDTRIADEDHDLAVQATRLSQDRATEDYEKGIQKNIDKNNEQIKGWEADQSALDALFTSATGAMDTAGNSMLSLATDILNIVDPAKAAATGGIPATKVRQLGEQVPAHARGGRIPGFEGLSLVGDAPGGVLTPYSEIISEPGASVTPVQMLRALGVGGGNSFTINVGGVSVTGSFQPGDIEGTIEQALAPIRRQLRAQLTRNTDHATAVGRGRVA